MNTTLAKPAKLPPVARHDLKVLLVDDDSFQLELISEVLRGLGIHDITTAASGAQALQAMGSKPPRFNLLLMDLHMPGMDGFQFMGELASTGYTGALIIVSGQSDDVMHAASLVAKLRRFTLLGSVPKPIGRAALAQLIAQLA
jgi:CheY-like chemotaxis protein